ncbi:MAG TPA: 4Fe-4S dicluster domain-containing protein [Acidimicrobiales bacterium]|nr:4Fe-4S dicluster domain-containing protein [Acidimicrobiales bacterium]
MPIGEAVVIDRHGLDQLISSLAGRGYRVLGPVVRDQAISIGEVHGTDDLPEGWHDTQAPGTYRLEHGDDPALFAWAVGQDSIKADVFPSRSVVWRATVTEGSVRLEETVDRTPPTALVGARPCELAALGVLDKVLGGAAGGDPLYSRRRAGFVLVAECGTPSGTCFCTSMGTGPAAGEGFDLALSELLDEHGHRFLVRAGSDKGAELLDELSAPPADAGDLEARAAMLEDAASHMGRHLDTDDLPGLLARNLEHWRWDDVASRCLACGNCTLVCPTCFCATVRDTTDVGGGVERERTWASCFDLAHSYLHGGPVRETTRSRYRQWMTHKLSTWWDQFGVSGCVGCGRCITWCPVGIDITEECAAIRAADGERATSA